jgi:hypothetical protein
MTTTVKVAIATRMTMKMNVFRQVIVIGIVAMMVKGIETVITVTLVAMTIEIEPTIARIMTMTVVAATDLQTGIGPVILGVAIHDGSLFLFLAFSFLAMDCTLVYLVKSPMDTLCVKNTPPPPSQFKKKNCLINCAGAHSTYCPRVLLERNLKLLWFWTVSLSCKIPHRKKVTKLTLVFFSFDVGHVLKRKVFKFEVFF